jgi:predicted GH43/DUF377 family glycosyl hydrolase
MITVKKEGVILLKTEAKFENEGVLNPAILKEGNQVHVLYRAVHEGNYSTIGYCLLEGPLTVKKRNSAPLLSPVFHYESHGIEDPRLVKIDDLYYLSYTAFNGTNALGALATSTDLITFERHGIIVPQITFDEFEKIASSTKLVNRKYFRQMRHIKEDKTVLLWDKNVVFFPRKINGLLYFLHRIRPGIQIVSVEKIGDLTKTFWEKYFLQFNDFIVLDPLYKHEASYLGGGCPPIETEHGWLLIYHGVYDTPKGYVYNACAALLDLENPRKELSRLPYALFSPEFEWEKHGVVDFVVFPTGTAIFGDTLYIYYGAADKQIACASVSLTELVNELINNIKKDEH